jgi:hypothetical protein
MIVLAADVTKNADAPRLHHSNAPTDVLQQRNCLFRWRWVNKMELYHIFNDMQKEVEVLDFLVGYESYLRNRAQVLGATVFIYRFFTGLSLRRRADTSKVTVHDRIQHL